MNALKRVGPALGVILSLLLVAYEIRQNTNATRGATTLAIAEQSLSLVFAAGEHPELRQALRRTARGMQYAQPDDITNLGWYYIAVMRVAEDRFRQVQLGTIDKAALGQLGGEGYVYRHPFFAPWWKFVRDRYPADFAEWVDTALAPLSQDSLPRATGVFLGETPVTELPGSQGH